MNIFSMKHIIPFGHHFFLAEEKNNIPRQCFSFELKVKNIQKKIGKFSPYLRFSMSSTEDICLQITRKLPNNKIFQLSSTINYIVNTNDLLKPKYENINKKNLIYFLNSSVEGFVVCGGHQDEKKF
jgi:hypothetical protein